MGLNINNKNMEKTNWESKHKKLAAKKVIRENIEETSESHQNK